MQVVIYTHMTPEQFTYWLQGYIEINGEQPTPEQWKVIKDHIKTVFHKVTPDYSNPYNPQQGFIQGIQVPQGDPKYPQPTC